MGISAKAIPCRRLPRGKLGIRDDDNDDGYWHKIVLLLYCITGINVVAEQSRLTRFH